MIANGPDSIHSLDRQGAQTTWWTILKFSSW